MEYDGPLLGADSKNAGTQKYDDQQHHEELYDGKAATQRVRKRLRPGVHRIFRGGCCAAQFVVVMCVLSHASSYFFTKFVETPKNKSNGGVCWSKIRVERSLSEPSSALSLKMKL